jgi:class 3 adenylate cyclase
VSNLQLFVERFEALAAQHGLEKIKTIGDAVLATGNLLAPHADPVLASLRLGFELMQAASTNPARWQIRAGIHVGPVVAGIIGQSKLSYDLWGDTVNVAARLATLDGPGLTLSKAAWTHVDGRCVGVSLGEVPIKGKAPLAVWRCEALREPPCGTSAICSTSTPAT